MTQQRAGLGLDEDQIDIEELTGATPQPPQDNAALKAALDKAGEKTGFVSRETPKKQRGRPKGSPYIVQKNFKARLGMSELLAELTKQLKNKTDQETIEQAIGALIEANGLKGLAVKFEKMTKDS